MNIENIQKLVKLISNTIDGNEKIATPILVSKLAKYVEKYPSDQTIGGIYTILSKMEQNNKLFIKRSELNDLYKRLYSRNTKFADLFSEEMGYIEKTASPKLYNRDDTQEPLKYESEDKVLSNALSGIFEKNAILKQYSQPLADEAKKMVGLALDAWNLNPNSIEVEAGNERFLVIKANYETPKGLTSFYVPIEITNNKVSEAEMFMGNSGPQELNNVNIKKYLTSKAGDKLKVTGSGILEVLVKSANNNREISSAELALIRLNSSRKNQSEFFEGNIVGQKVAEASKKEVNLPKYEDVFSFEKQFTTPTGIANFKFGNKVSLARDNIVRDLNSFGYKNPQINVNKVTDDTIYYSVSLDGGKLGFTVPIKVGNSINKANILICNGSIEEFSKEGINNLYINNKNDYKAAAVASPLFGLKNEDLLNNIRLAVAEGNNSKAEDALNIIANSGDEMAYGIGLKLLSRGLAEGKPEPKEDCKCTMVVKSNTSQYPICGHTGLPINKVYQDKHGNCRPLYRRGEDETYEGATFMNAKIFG